MSQSPSFRRPVLQRAIQVGRRLVPRGWSRVLFVLARSLPSLRQYPVRLEDGSTLYVDLRNPMSHGYFFHGRLPHEPLTHRILEEYLQEGSVFVDVGANVGYFTTLAAQRVGGSGIVIAFEPLPDALRSLRANAALYPQVDLRESAVGRAHGRATFTVRASGDLSALGEQPGASAYIEVDVTTLDHSLETLDRLDVLKVDVEGGETDVIEGAMQTLRRLRPVLLVESLDDCLRRSGSSDSILRSTIRRAGYRISGPEEHGYPQPYLWCTPES